jgi:hypothetical protein
MTEHGPQFERENMRLGLALLALFLVLLGLSFAAAFIYLAVL